MISLDIPPLTFIDRLQYVVKRIKNKTIKHSHNIFISRQPHPKEGLVNDINYHNASNRVSSSSLDRNVTALPIILRRSTLSSTSSEQTKRTQLWTLLLPIPLKDKLKCAIN